MKKSSLPALGVTIICLLLGAFAAPPAEAGPLWLFEGAFAEYIMGSEVPGFHKYATRVFLRTEEGWTETLIPSHFIYGWAIERVDAGTAKVRVYLYGNATDPWRRELIYNLSATLYINVETFEVLREDGSLVGRWPFAIKPSELHEGRATLATNLYGEIKEITIGHIKAPRRKDLETPYGKFLGEWIAVGWVSLNATLRFPGRLSGGPILTRILIQPFYDARTLMLIAQTAAHADDILYNIFNIYIIPTGCVQYKGKQYDTMIALLRTNVFDRLIAGPPAERLSLLYIGIGLTAVVATVTLGLYLGISHAKKASKLAPGG